jgi:hypothetical protein
MPPEPMVHEFVAGTLGILAGGFCLTTKLSASIPELARIGQAVDAIAIEVERLSEAERFQTKLLAERTSSARA